MTCPFTVNEISLNAPAALCSIIQNRFDPKDLGYRLSIIILWNVMVCAEAESRYCPVYVTDDPPVQVRRTGQNKHLPCPKAVSKLNVVRRSKLRSYSCAWT